MSLGPFTTLLIPSTKNGKLQFWNDLTQQIIEANFSRPNVDDTSGAGVWRNGVFIELAENEVDWDDSSGCPVIKMRPQATNYANSPIDFSSWYAGQSATITKNNALDVFGNMDAIKVVTAVQSLSGINGGNTPIGTAGVNITISCYMKGELGGEEVRLAAASGSGTITSSPFTLTTEYVKYSFTGIAPNTTVFPQTNNSASPSVKTYYVSAFQVSYLDTDFIPKSNLTRAANTFEFTDLITKGAIAANGAFTLLINPYIYENVDYNTAVVRFLSGSTRLFDFAMYPEGRLRVLDRINGGWITPTQNAGEGLKPIILVFNGATKILKVYFQGALQGTSPNLTLSVDTVEFNAPDDIAYDLHDLDFSPILLNDTEAIAVLNSL
jgi:hypothetical protein